MADASQRDTRERILAAAAAIVAEDGLTARLTVRAVATRAGVSIGSMRHHFPSQQALREEVTRRISGWLLPGEPMRDPTLPPQERLLRSLRQVLAGTGHGQHARDALMTAVDTFVAPEQTPQLRQAYLALEDDGRRRVEDWLSTLAEEGQLPAAAVPRHARFLVTVLNGLTLQRAFPGIDALSQVEEETLRAAVDAVLPDGAGAS